MVSYLIIPMLTPPTFTEPSPIVPNFAFVVQVLGPREGGKEWGPGGRLQHTSENLGTLFPLVIIG